MGSSGCLAYVVWPLAVPSIIVLAVWVVAWVRIFFKAGYRYPIVMAILMLVPIANLVLLCLLAFSKWPIQHQLEMRTKVGAIPRFQ